MEKFILSIMEKRINFYTDSKLCISALKSGEKVLKTIPCEIKHIGFFTIVEENKDLIVYTNSNTKSVKINQINNLAFLTGKEEELFFPDLVYLALCMFARIFQEENKYFLQASTVKYDDENSLMFIGDPGSGKTTTSYLLAKNTGGSLVSNDNVLVGYDSTFKTYRGTHLVQMRLGAIKLFCKELLPNLNIPQTDKNEWDIKIYIDELLKNMNFNFSNESNVKKIYFLNSVPNANATIRQREQIDKLLLMYEHLTKQIRSTRYALTSFDTPIPSFEIEEYLGRRYDLAKKISENIPIYEAKGDTLKLAKKIERDL